MNQKEYTQWLSSRLTPQQLESTRGRRKPLYALPTGDRWIPAFLWPHEKVFTGLNTREYGWLSTERKWQHAVMNTYGDVDGIPFTEWLLNDTGLQLAYFLPFFDHLRIPRHLPFFRTAAYFADPAGCRSLHSPLLATPFLPEVAEEDMAAQVNARLQEFWNENSVATFARHGGHVCAPHNWLAVHYPAEYAVENPSAFSAWAIHHHWFPFRNAMELMIGHMTLGGVFQHIPRLTGLIDSDSEIGDEDDD